MCPLLAAQVLHSLLSLKTCFPEQFSLWMPVGARHDLLSAMEAALTKAWPKRVVYVVIIGSDKQKSRSKSSYALWMPMDITQEAPAMINCSGCRGKSSEGLRLRCERGVCALFCQPTDAACPAEDDDFDENADIPEDDMETPLEAHVEEDDDHVEESEVLDGEDMRNTTAVSALGAKKTVQRLYLREPDRALQADPREVARHVPRVALDRDDPHGAPEHLPRRLVMSGTCSRTDIGKRKHTTESENICIQLIIAFAICVICPLRLFLLSSVCFRFRTRTDKEHQEQRPFLIDHICVRFMACASEVFRFQCLTSVSQAAITSWRSSRWSQAPLTTAPSTESRCCRSCWRCRRCQRPRRRP